MSKSFIAYTRVSTQRQGELGASLHEQRRVIGEYARRHDIQIDLWLEEHKSASKGRRPVFDDLIKRLLKPKNKSGLILHKLDRGVRSIRDWAEIGDLIDRGVDVRFANDDLNLGTRGGRLAADMATGRFGLRASLIVL